jgi:hypothetical protein
MPILKHLPADAPPETISAILDADGALILDGAAGPRRVTAGEIFPATMPAMG